MTQEQAAELGAILRNKRKKLGLSTYRLGALVDTNQATIIRLEQGQFSAPRPDKLARIAKALGLSLADLFARAGYLVPDDLPSFETYLFAKYHELPKAAITELVQCFEAFAKRHGVNTDEPLPQTEGSHE